MVRGEMVTTQAPTIRGASTVRLRFVADMVKLARSGRETALG